MEFPSLPCGSTGILPEHLHIAADLEMTYMHIGWVGERSGPGRTLHQHPYNCSLEAQVCFYGCVGPHHVIKG